MSVFRGVFMFRSGDKEFFYAERKPRRGQEDNPDLYVDCLRYSNCIFHGAGKGRVTKIVDQTTGNVYYIDPSCQVFQE